jgi:hypothetical protein
MPCAVSKPAYAGNEGHQAVQPGYKLADLPVRCVPLLVGKAATTSRFTSGNN